MITWQQSTSMTLETVQRVKEFVDTFFVFPYMHQLTVGLLLSMCIWASMTDITENKVYNKMCATYVVARLLVCELYPITSQTLFGGIVGFILLFTPAFILNTSHMAGDIKFAAVLGLWIGPVPVLIALLFATLSFIVISLVKRKGMHGIMPYAPFISTGCLVTVFIQYYVDYLSIVF